LKLVVRPEWGGDAWSIVNAIDEGTHFFHRYLQPLTVDGGPLNLAQVTEMLLSASNGGRWALSTQAHRFWNLPYGDPEKLIPPSEWTDGMRHLVDFSIEVARCLIGRSISVKIVNEPIALPHLAWYGRGRGVLAFNVGRLGRKWFEGAHLGIRPNHLTKEFADEVGRLAVKLMEMSLRDVRFVERYRILRGDDRSDG
jgi:hypothetical protein